VIPLALLGEGPCDASAAAGRHAHVWGHVATSPTALPGPLALELKVIRS